MKTAKALLKKQETGVLLAFIVTVIVFSLLSPHFMTLRTWGGVLTSSAEIGIIALGATLLITAGEFDLSVGSNFAFSGMIFALLATNLEINSYLAFIAALSCGAFIGLLNGWITLKTGIPSFITTLGSMLFWRGIVLLITDGFPISALDTVPVMNWFGKSLGEGFHSSLIVWVGLCIFFAYLLKHHPLGNWIMATGGNRDASFAMGIRTSRTKLLCFVVSGLLAALAGVIQYSHLETLSPTAGDQYELRAIAIAVIGGTLLTGGVGTVFGTILGTLLMGILASGLVQAGVSTYWFRSLVGVVLVLAVVVNFGFNGLKKEKA